MPTEFGEPKIYRNEEKEIQEIVNNPLKNIDQASRRINVGETGTFKTGIEINSAGLTTANKSSDIVYWAGTAQEDKESAPFRIDAAGNITANSLTIAGFLGSVNDGLTQATGGSGAMTRGLINTEFRSGATANSAVSLTGTAAGAADVAGNALNFSNNYEIVIKFKTSAFTNCRFGFGQGTEVCPSFANTSMVAATESGYRFYNVNGTLYASNTTGSAETRTEITGVTLSAYNKYRIAYTATSNIKFYVNDILRATHTTNIPSGNTDFTALTIKMNSGTPGTTNFVVMENNYTVKEI